jgi:hypothetical protein
MSKSVALLIAIALLAILASGCVAYVRPAPPPPRVEVMDLGPYPAAVWVPGHWQWRPRIGEYVWIPGRWRR